MAPIWYIAMVVVPAWAAWLITDERKKRKAKTKSVSNNLNKMSINDSLTPFEAADKIIELKDAESRGYDFDYNAYKHYRNIMEDNSSIKIAEKEITSRNIFDAVDWYLKYKSLKFYFKDETYRLMIQKIEKEIFELDIDSLTLDDLLDSMDLAKLYLPEKSKIKVETKLYQLQKKELFDDILNLTPNKAAINVGGFIKKYRIISPDFEKLKIALDEITEDDEVILPALQKIHMRKSRAKKDKPEKLPGLLEEEKIQRDRLRELIQEKIYLIFEN